MTEEVLGIDLVKSQLAVAAGATLAELGLAQAEVPAPRGYAMQLRVNMETMDETGATQPTGGTLTAFDPPSGPGVRVDSFGYAGYRTSAAFDSLLAKVIVHVPAARWGDVVAKAARDAARIPHRRRRRPTLRSCRRCWPTPISSPTASARASSTAMLPRWCGAAKTAAHPLFFAVGAAAADAPMPVAKGAVAGPAGSEAVAAPLQGTVVAIEVSEGDLVRPGQQIAVIESMKMEHLVTAPHGGTITKIAASDGVTLMQGEPILFIEPAEVDGAHAEEETTVDLDHIRPDLAEVIARHANTLDASRPASVARRRKTNQRTARENIAQLVDAGSFVEYGSLAIAAQRRRRKLDDLIQNTPADGLITGVATVNADKVGAGRGALHGDRLRLHRAGRHPGPYEPQEDRPHAFAHRAVAASAGVLCGRRRRPSRRYRPARHDRPRRPVLRAVRETVGPRAGGRRRLGLLLRRQCRACWAAAT